MPNDEERFGYPSTATTVIVRQMVPLLLFVLGIGLFLWAGREFYTWLRPWAVWPLLALGLLSWVAAGYLLTLLPEVRAGDRGLRVRRLVLLWRRIPWPAVADVRETGQLNLLGWVEPVYTLIVWHPRAGRRGRVRREWHRRPVRGLRFSGHIRNCERLLKLISQHAPPSQDEPEGARTETL